jgi:hypothetical protein
MFVTGCRWDGRQWAATEFRAVSSNRQLAHRNRIERRMAVKEALLVVLLALSVSGCATPVKQSNAPLSKYDKNTDYGIEPRQDGFGISIYYSRYQFVPESDAVATACKQALTSIAWEHGEKQGKEILPINEQAIRLSMGRNGVSGITSCSAFATVKWK